MDLIQKEECENLWCEYESKLRKICRAKLSNSTDADEVVSSVFLALCKQIEKEGIPNKPRQWLYGTLNNILNLQYRSIYREKHYIDSLEDIKIVLPNTQDEIDKEIENIYNDELKNQLRLLLSQDEYKIIYYIYFEQLKMKEVAKKMNTTENAVKQKHYRICKKLKKISAETVVIV